uniref:Putative ovule protein n=1 Tax=Solanum chacoense TaxID=4108 RepID=A0A0V0GY05_SOLCH
MFFFIYYLYVCFSHLLYYRIHYPILFLCHYLFHFLIFHICYLHFLIHNLYILSAYIFHLLLLFLIFVFSLDF